MVCSGLKTYIYVCMYAITGSVRIKLLVLNTWIMDKIFSYFFFKIFFKMWKVCVSNTK